MNRGGGPQGGSRRERRWQSSQERARVAAELIEEAESLTQTGAIATPKDVARDGQPPPLRVAQPVATPAPLDVTDRLEDEEPPPPSEPVGAAPPPPPRPPPPPPPPAPPPAPAPRPRAPVGAGARGGGGGRRAG